MKKQTWHLDLFKVHFERGWKSDKTVDRYEGEIRFKNESAENFTIKLDAEKSQKIIDILSEQIVATAQDLTDKIRLDFTN